MVVLSIMYVPMSFSLKLSRKDCLICISIVVAGSGMVKSLTDLVLTYTSSIDDTNASQILMPLNNCCEIKKDACKICDIVGFSPKLEEIYLVSEKLRYFLCYKHT